MHTRRLPAGITRGLVLATLVLGVAFLQVQTNGGTAQASVRGYVPTNPKILASSIRLAAQHFLVDQAKQTAATRKAVAAAKLGAHGNSATYPGDCTAFAAFNAPGGANIWNKDGCDMLESEESIALNLNNSYLVGGVNDFGGFFGENADNPFSLTGYTVASSAAGGAIKNWGDLPGILDPGCADGSVLESFGDPYVGAATKDATAYLASLALPNNSTSACAISQGDNGILVSVGNNTLYTGSCSDHETSSTCWTPKLVHQANVSGCSTGVSPCQSDDKESLAVDNTSSSAGYGNVYIAWDLFDSGTGAQVGEVVGCSAHLASCSAPVVFTGTSTNVFAPYVAVRHDGSIEISYDDLATTDGTVHLDLTRCTVSGFTPTCGTPNNFDKINNTVTCTTSCDASNVQFIQGLATNGLRILTQVKIAVDDTTGANAGHTYAVWEQCATKESYFGFLCGASNIEMDDIATPTSAGTRVGYPGGRYDDFMPTVAVDQTNGHVYVAYYSTKTDLVTFASTPGASDTGNHSGIRAFLTTSSGGTGLLQAPFGATVANDSYQADQCVQLGCAPQFGDYFQVVANAGHAYLHFNVNFKQKGGPIAIWEVNGLVNQEDNYMCRFLTFPPTNTAHPCS